MFKYKSFEIYFKRQAKNNNKNNVVVIKYLSLLRYTLTEKRKTTTKTLLVVIKYFLDYRYKDYRYFFDQ